MICLNLNYLLYSKLCHDKQHKVKLQLNAKINTDLFFKKIISSIGRRLVKFGHFAFPKETVGYFPTHKIKVSDFFQLSKLKCRTDYSRPVNNPMCRTKYCFPYFPLSLVSMCPRALPAIPLFLSLKIRRSAIFM